MNTLHHCYYQEETTVSNALVLWSCLFAIVVSITVTFKWKINLGFLTMGFAFIIGCMMQGETFDKIYGYWPDTIVSFLIGASLLFGFAAENGTMKVLGDKLLWKFRKNMNYIPFLIFFMAMILGFLGAGPATIVILTPLAYLIGTKARVDPMLIVLSIAMGYITAGYNPWTGSGAIFLGLVEKNAGAAGAATAFPTYMKIWMTFIFKQLLFITIFFVFYQIFKKKWNKKNQGSLAVEESPAAAEFMIEKPADLNPVQKKTLTLILISCIVMVVPSLLNVWLHPSGEFFKHLLQLIKPQSVLLIAAVFASIMKLADQKKVIDRLPISAILMIVGVTFLIGIATKAGLIDILVAFFKGAHIPKFLVAPALSVLAGVLCIFGSATFVVAPLLFTMVPALSTALGIDPVSLYAAIVIGADGVGSISPFGDAGSKFIAFTPEALKERMITRQFGMMFVVGIMCGLGALLGLWNIFAH
ncbi:SLC13 family permease [Paenibacillus thalictri]|uniref:Dicarboxylate carrier MatC N-terminal domain-containing protein n=1 Tax=Paenibacillus thalictri TaxID=2527873 RepID=A0A4Q9DP11_9BACL|nr:SLC13 family permease [Paenibacillus thalictri]TBL76313.1 hypothetical protein EYB31_20165 [Paenibacillus thalictri]